MTPSSLPFRRTSETCIRRCRAWPNEQRARHLDSLVGKEHDLWQRVEGLIATKQPKRYDEAVVLLTDLRDLAERQGAISDFSPKMQALRRVNAQKVSLMRKLQEARL